jgi:hypothetical protein
VNARGSPREQNGAATLLGLLLAVIGATVAGVATAGWANSALDLPVSQQVISLFARRQPERALVGATPGPAVARGAAEARGPAEAPSCAPGQISPSQLFSGLRDAIGETFGQPLECPHVDPSTGDTLQRTSTGLAIYRSRSHIPTFTDGYHRWAKDARGVIAWEGHVLDPPD